MGPFIIVEEAAAFSGTDTIVYNQAAHLAVVRAFVRARARALGLTADRADLLTLAVSELTTNTLQHTSGGGHVRIWAAAGQLNCDVIDSGPVRALDRAMPPADAERGRGLAIVARLCDEVTTLTSAGSTLVRMRFAL